MAARLALLDETMGRRTWPDEEKLRIVMESYVPGARVGDVARKYRLLPSQLTTWRRMAREGRFGLPPDVSGVPDVGAFVPLMLDGGAAAPQAIRDDRMYSSGDGRGQAALISAFSSGFQCHGSNSGRRESGRSEILAMTSASQACGSIPLSLAVPIREYMKAARCLCLLVTVRPKYVCRTCAGAQHAQGCVSELVEI